jgi:hypothetical protein
MTRLPDILNDLADTDAVSGELRSLAAERPQDEIIAINLGAVAKRRRDLERELDAELRHRQFDLVQYRIEQYEGGVCPASAVARAILLFQSLVTSIFDAIRTAPKHRYHPSNENIRLSTMTFAAAPADSVVISFSIPNDRLLILQSDLDLTFELLFNLLAARSKTMFRQIAERVGIASVSMAHSWAENAVQFGLNTAITWRKTGDEGRSAALSHSDALLLKTAIEGTGDEHVDQIDCDCELLGIDEAASTFRIRNADGEAIDGDLADGFPRGESWTTRRWYTATLTRATQIRYANGAEATRWTLRELIPQN